MKIVNRTGFTLTELLVIIAIIAILSAILFPVFTKARVKSGQTECLSNIKQLGLAMLMYMSDYNQTYPNVDAHLTPDGKDYAGTANDIANGGWANHLNVYVKNAALFKCPSATNGNRVGIACDYTYNYYLGQDKSIPAFTDETKLGWYGYTSFTSNTLGLPYGKPLTEVSVDMPSVVACFWESYPSDDPGHNVNGDTCTMANGYAHIFFGPSLRHNSGCNVCAVDGHADYVTWPVKETSSGEGQDPKTYSYYKLGPFWTLPKHAWRCMFPTGSQYDCQHDINGNGTGTPIDGS